MDASRSKAQAPELIGRLVEDFQAGLRQEENFRRLFDCYYGSVLRFFEKRGCSREEARELTQETFIRVYKGMETFRRDARFDTWLFKIAANTYHKALRWRGARKRAGAHVGWESLTAETTGQLEAFEPASLAAGQEPLNQVLNAERVALLKEAIGELPEQMRKCVILRVHQELRYEEIALVLCVSVETVKDHLVLCAECAQRLLDLRSIVELQQTEPPSLSDAELTEAWQEIRPGLKTRERKGVLNFSGVPSPAWIPPAVAASFLIVIIGLGGWIGWLTQQNRALRVNLDRSSVESESQQLRRQLQEALQCSTQNAKEISALRKVLDEYSQPQLNVVVADLFPRGITPG